MHNIFEQALHISSPCFIKDIRFTAEKKRQDITVDFRRGATFEDTQEDESVRKAYTAHDTIEKTWRHLNFFEHECHLHARVPRIRRDDGGCE